MGTIFIPDDDYYNAADSGKSREINRIRDAAPKHFGTVYVYVLGKASESPFKVGSKVYVKAPGYDFSAKVWYIYQGSNGYNLYVRTPPTGGEVFSGVVSTEPIDEIRSEDMTSEPDVELDVQQDAEPTATDKVKDTIKAVAGDSSKTNWLLYAGVAVAGFFLWKKFGKNLKKK